MTFDELTRLDNKQLERFMTGSPEPAVSDLAGFDFRGWNIAAGSAIIGARKFFKGVFGAPGKPHAWGYNMQAEQNAKDQPWVVRKKKGEPIRYFYFKVLSGSAVAGSIHPRTLVIDYRGWPDYFPLFPIKYTVDYLVYPDPANHDLMIGKSYNQMLGMKLFLGFFILERFQPSGYSGPTGFTL